MSHLHSLGKTHIPFTEQPEDFFVLSDMEKEHIRTKRGAYNRVKYAILLKFFECEGQFPDRQLTVGSTIKEFLAKQLGVPFEDTELSERTLHRFYVSIRTFAGYKKMTVQNKKDLAEHLKKEVLPYAPSDEELFEAMVQFCRKNKCELFAKKEVDRFLASIQKAFDNNLFEVISKLLSDETKQKLDLLLEEKPVEIETETPITQEQKVALDSSENLDVASTATKKKKEQKPEKEYLFILDDLKKDTSRLKKSAILYEIKKYEFLKNLQIREKAMEPCQRPLLIKYERRVRTMYPSHLKEQTLDVRYAELAMFCFVAFQRSADILTEVLLKLLHRIGVPSPNCNFFRKFI